MSRLRVGRVRVGFSTIEEFAAQEPALSMLGLLGNGWQLSRASSLHRRKDGSYTLVLVYKSDDSKTFTSTHRGLRLEQA